MVTLDVLEPDTRLVARYTEASAGRQSAASFIDLACVLLVGTAVFVASRSVPLTALCTLQAVLVIALWEASRGATPGQLALGVRTVRAESLGDARAGILPAGTARIVRKYLVLAGSTCLFVVGLPIALCSPLFSASRRGWADRAGAVARVDVRSRTLVSVPVKPRDIPDYSRSDDSLDVHLDMPVVLPAESVAQPAAAASTPTPRPAMPPRPAVAVQAPAAPAAPVMQVPLPERPAPRHAAVPAPTPSLPSRPVPQTGGRTRLFLRFADGTSMPLSVPSTLVLGRKPSAQRPGDIPIAVPDTTGTVSRNHARLELLDGQWWITDLGSTNGTRIIDGGEERALAAKVRTPLSAGSRLSLGETGCSIVTATQRSA
ncbi:transRDD family protein [Bifidobacterium cuniculi]|uniref:TransRDD family protein n=2 Tax=Bifidobacterium cuniculi TaxID=1688 RepID=A0A087AYP5_9BIFI|nr:FHA domain-containing protein [Bifidobacterium cuniculi]KFI63895.1 transRDD family protein [Bifidobacterium cuniculi]